MSANDAKFIKEIYFKADPEYSLRFTMPILWDKKTQTIVNNESSEIIRMFHTAFDDFSSAPAGVSYYPEKLRSEINASNEWIYPGINNGVYASIVLGLPRRKSRTNKPCRKSIRHWTGWKRFRAKARF